MEENLSIYTSHKGLITRIYRKLKKKKKNLNFQEINNPLNKWANELK
jgi:hypothetical protein